ncbi:MAG: hypothetical protein KC609_07345 [Myxococcales bacterium]|nr:hypothetical protein [Myxococcales bacterium]
MRSPSITKATLVLGLLVGLGLSNVNCVVNNKNTFVIVGNVFQEGDTCQLTASTTELRTFGTLDLAMAKEYDLFPVLSNRLPNQIAITGNVDTTVASNDIRVKRYRISLKSSGTATEYDRTLEVNSNFIITAGGTLSVQVLLVPPQVINELRQDAVFNGNVSDVRQVRVELSARLKFYGETLAGWGVETDWFNYSILLCRGCLSSAEDIKVADGETCFGSPDAAQLKGGCSLGQDLPVDCRLCTQNANSEQDKAFCVP